MVSIPPRKSTTLIILSTITYFLSNFQIIMDGSEEENRTFLSPTNVSDCIDNKTISGNNTTSNSVMQEYEMNFLGLVTITLPLGNA